MEKVLFLVRKQVALGRDSAGAVPPNCTRHTFSVAGFKSLSTDSWTRNAPALRLQVTELINHMWVIVLLSGVLRK